MLGFFHDRGDVQQRLGRNAADVEANAAEGGVALNDDRLHAEVGRTEGSGIAAGASAEDEHFALDVGTAGMATGNRSGHWSRSRCGGRGFRFCCIFRVDRSNCAALNLDQQSTFANLGAEGNEHFLDHAGDRRGHIHCCLVGLQRADRVIHLDAVADLDEQVDDRHFGEIADVGDFDFYQIAHGVPPLQRDATEVGQQLSDIDIEAGR